MSPSSPHKAAEQATADDSKANIFMPVFRGSWNIFTVIDVEDCNLIFSKQTVKRLHNIIKMMDDIISAVACMTSVKADSQFIILDNSIINPGKFFKIPSDF